MLSFWRDLRAAFAFLTILPVGWPSDVKPGRSFAYYPLVGLAIGAVTSAVASAGVFAPDLTAFLALLTWIVLTGGLHLDGWADSCDGLLATAEPERRLEIMKDPRTGSWAVIGLIVLLLGKWVALREMSPVLLILPPVMGRWAMVLAVASFRYGRAAGLGSYFRAGFGRLQLVFASLCAVAIALAFGWPALLVIIVPPVTVTAAGSWATHRLGGGLTGDVYGALCELTELMCLFVLADL
jgi:adenosylcobinamide-GDP ribazoletransferase